MGFLRTEQHRGRFLLPAACACVSLGLAPSALADEPRAANEPRLLEETAGITQVVDAFDEGDLFDLKLSLGYEYSMRSAPIRRETSIIQPGLSTGGYVSDALSVAEYEESTSRLQTRAEIGLYKDIALILRMPVILSHSRKLSDLDGSSDTNSLNTQGLVGESLFSVPFESPTRSGIEYLAVGFDFGLMNQTRDWTNPTWIVGFEGRFDVSEPMHACNENPEPEGVKCAYPSDVNRNGRSDGDDEGSFSGERDPGVSRGTTGLEIHTYVSKRVKYIEPYGGFLALLEFQNNSSDYGATDLEGSLVNRPPLRGSMVVGLEVIPWEIREKFQRIALDFRFTGTYVSEGRDYSELFDALGSSPAPSLRNPNYAAYHANPDPDGPASVVDPNSQKVYVTGLTDVQQHGDYLLSTQFSFQAGEFIKFNLGAGYRIIQSHMITFDQPCNPNIDASPGESGPCQSDSGDLSGLPNPNYRRVINAPGRRFMVGTSTGLQAWLNASVMF
ncbi:MAG TPA: hypothetical protein VI197_09500 [Polyangiaceae bacterium]